MKILNLNQFLNESTEYNAFDICREICDYYDIQDDTEDIGYSDIDSFLDEYYPDISDVDKKWVYDRMEKFANVSDYVSRSNDEDN